MLIITTKLTELATIRPLHFMYHVNELQINSLNPWCDILIRLLDLGTNLELHKQESQVLN